MGAFSYQRKPIQKTKSASSAASRRAFPGRSYEVRSIVHVQRTIGNQAAQRLPPDSTASTGFFHDFSKVPVHGGGSNVIQPNQQNAQGSTLAAGSSLSSTPGSGVLQRKCSGGGDAASSVAGGGEEYGRQLFKAEHPLQASQKLERGAPDEQFEQEADRIADAVMRMPDPTVASTALSRTYADNHRALPHVTPRVQRQAESEKEREDERLRPAPLARMQATGSVAPVTAWPAVHNVLRSAGQPLKGTARTFLEARVKTSGKPLEASTRAFMEARFGHDFSQVRVHDDIRADESARSVHALAYTAGHHVVFAGGQYQPRTVTGLRLLAHELTHVAQQGAHQTAPTIQRKTGSKAKAPFYQEAVEALDKEKRARVTLSTGGVIDLIGRVPVLEKFVTLAEAVEKENVKEIPTLLDDFLKTDTTRLPIGFPSDPLVNTMVSRLLLLGLGDVAERFRKWYLQHERQQKTRSGLGGEFLSERFIWEQVLEELTAQIPEKGAVPALKVLDALLLLFQHMRDEAVGLDEEAIKKDRERMRSISSIMDQPFVRDVTISVYFDSLMELLKGAFTSIQMAYQVVLDQAIDDLGAGQGSPFLEAANARLNRLLDLIDPLEEKKKSVGMTVAVTRSEFKPKGSRHLDVFAKGKEAKRRTIGIEFYDKELGELMGEEKKLNFARVCTIRRNQIMLLERIYGLEKDKQGALTAETKENAAAVATLGKTGLRLENDDDWRRFLLEKFEARRAKESPAEAFIAIIRLLESFLQAFTTHTPYNIEDFGDNHLTKEFPRTLTGRLIHDCGVYALRIAYMLSLLRGHKDLNLRFRFIVLPVHVGLIITGDGLPAYIAHNDRIVVFPTKDLADIRSAWVRTDEHGNPQAAAAKPDEDQFMAELAGQEFISGVDLPYALLEVPEPKGSAAQVKRDLWRHYTRKVARLELFGPLTNDPKNEFYQYHLKYLEVLERMKSHWNDELLPFWNGAHQIWLKREPALNQALAKLKTAKTGDEQKEAQKAYDKLVEDYRTLIEPRFQAMNDKFGPILTAQLEIVATLKEHPEIIKQGIPVTRSSRVEEVFRGPWWSREFFDHLSLLMARKEVWAPFAKPEDQLQPID